VVKNFINYTLSNIKNISERGIRCSCKRCKNKKFLDPNIVMMHLLQKEFMKKNTCIDMHTKNHMFLMIPW